MPQHNRTGLGGDVQPRAYEGTHSSARGTSVMNAHRSDGSGTESSIKTLGRGNPGNASTTQGLVVPTIVGAGAANRISPSKREPVRSNLVSVPIMEGDGRSDPKPDETARGSNVPANTPLRSQPLLPAMSPLTYMPHHIRCSLPNPSGSHKSLVSPQSQTDIHQGTTKPEVTPDRGKVNDWFRRVAASKTGLSLIALPLDGGNGGGQTGTCSVTSHGKAPYTPHDTSPRHGCDPVVPHTSPFKLSPGPSTYPPACPGLYDKTTSYPRGAMAMTGTSRNGDNFKQVPIIMDAPGPWGGTKNLAGRGTTPRGRAMRSMGHSGSAPVRQQPTNQGVPPLVARISTNTATRAIATSVPPPVNRRPINPGAPSAVHGTNSATRPIATSVPPPVNRQSINPGAPLAIPGTNTATRPIATSVKPPVNLQPICPGVPPLVTGTLTHTISKLTATSLSPPLSQQPMDHPAVPRASRIRPVATAVPPSVSRYLVNPGVPRMTPGATVKSIPVRSGELDNPVGSRMAPATPRGAPVRTPVSEKPDSSVGPSGFPANTAAKPMATPVSDQPMNPIGPRVLSADGATVEPDNPVAHRLSSMEGAPKLAATTKMALADRPFSTIPTAIARTTPVCEEPRIAASPRKTTATTKATPVGAGPNSTLVLTMPASNEAPTPAVESTSVAAKSTIIPKGAILPPNSKENVSQPSNTPGSSTQYRLPTVFGCSKNQTAEREMSNPNPSMNMDASKTRNLQRGASQEGSEKAAGKDLLHVFQSALSDLGEALNTFIRKDTKAKALTVKKSEATKLSKPSANTAQDKHEPGTFADVCPENPSLRVSGSEKRETPGIASAPHRPASDPIASSFCKVDTPPVKVGSSGMSPGVKSPEGKVQYLTPTGDRIRPKFPETVSTVPAVAKMPQTVQSSPQNSSPYLTPPSEVSQSLGSLKQFSAPSSSRTPEKSVTPASIPPISQPDTSTPSQDITLSTFIDPRRRSKKYAATPKPKDRGQPPDKSHDAKMSFIIKPTVLESPERYVNDEQKHHGKLYREPSSNFSLGRKELAAKTKSRSYLDAKVRVHAHWKASAHHSKHGSAGHHSSRRWSPGKQTSGSHQNKVLWNSPGRLPPTTRNAFTPPSPNVSSPEKISVGERSPVLSRYPQAYTPPGNTPFPPPASTPSPVASPSRPSSQEAPRGGSVSDGGGSPKAPRTKLQKSRSTVHPRRQPSFTDLLKIASHNAGKGLPASDLDYRLSRKRRHSDGQINRYKTQEGVKRPYNAGPRFQRLESLSEPERDSSGPSSRGTDSHLSGGGPGTETSGQKEVHPLSDQASAENPEKDPLTADESADNKSGAGRTHVEGIQGLFSELQSSSPQGEGSLNSSQGDSPHSPSSSPASSLPSSPSSTEKKKLLALSQMKKVRVKLSGLSLKKYLVEGGGSVSEGGLKATESAMRGDRDDASGTDGDGPAKEDGDSKMEDGDVARNGNNEEKRDGEGGSQFSDSSDDDDSFLMAKPAALIEETTALLDAPMPGTPSKRSLSTSFPQIPLSPGPSPMGEQPPVEKKPDIRYTLDKILHIKTIQERKYGDIGAIRTKLMDSVSTGGMAKLAEEATIGEHDEDIDPAEYNGHLMGFDHEAEKIPEVPPGEEIFHKENVCQLFTPTQCLLKFQTMNRVNGAEDLLGDSTIEEIEECIKTGFLECYYDGSQAPDSSMEWMFRLMSVHPSYHESQVLYDTLWSQLNKAPLWLDEVHFPWTPTVKEVITVLLNYGGDIAGLISVSDCDVSFTVGNLRKLDATAQDAAQRGDEYCQEPDFFSRLLDNQLGLVLKVLTQAIITHLAMKNCSGYRTEELQCLFIIMLRISLDKRVVGHPVIVDISNAVSAIIEGFEDVVWIQQVERLCVLFPLVTSHHHNMVYLIQNCIPLHLERGRYLYRMLGYAGLQKLVFPEKGWRDMTGHKVPDIKVASLIPILHCCKPSRETDYYQLNSIILLLDFSIGNERLQTDERRGLEKIIRKLREMVGDIRENALTLSRSQVKSLIVRTAAKLSFMTQSMITNKEGIFGFLQSDINDSLDTSSMNPEHHICSQTDPASDGEESTTEMEAEEDNGSLPTPGAGGPQLVKAEIKDAAGETEVVTGGGVVRSIDGEISWSGSEGEKKTTDTKAQEVYPIKSVDSDPGPSSIKSAGETVVASGGPARNTEENMEVGEDVSSSSRLEAEKTSNTGALDRCPSKSVNSDPGGQHQGSGLPGVKAGVKGKADETMVAGEGRLRDTDREEMDVGEDVSSSSCLEGEKTTDTQAREGCPSKLVDLDSGSGYQELGPVDAGKNIQEAVVPEKVDSPRDKAGEDVGNLVKAATGGSVRENCPMVVAKVDVEGPVLRGAPCGGNMSEEISDEVAISAGIMDKRDTRESHDRMSTGRKICQGSAEGWDRNEGGSPPLRGMTGTPNVAGATPAQAGESHLGDKASADEGEPSMCHRAPGKIEDPHRTDNRQTTGPQGGIKSVVSGKSIHTGIKPPEARTEVEVVEKEPQRLPRVNEQQELAKTVTKESLRTTDESEIQDVRGQTATVRGRGSSVCEGIGEERKTQAFNSGACVDMRVEILELPVGNGTGKGENRAMTSKVSGVRVAGNGDTLHESGKPGGAPARKVTSLSTVMGSGRDPDSGSVPSSVVVQLSTKQVSRGSVKVGKESRVKRKLAPTRKRLGDATKGGTREVVVKSEADANSGHTRGTSNGSGGVSGVGGMRGASGTSVVQALQSQEGVAQASGRNPTTVTRAEVIDLTESSGVEEGSDEEGVIWLE